MYCRDRGERMAAQCTLPWSALKANDSAKTAAATIDCSEQTSVTVTMGLVCSVCILHSDCRDCTFFIMYRIIFLKSLSVF